MKPVTLADIAAQVGVSRQTVANAISGRSTGAYPAAAIKLKRVRRAAFEMGYRPNTAARATASGKFKAVALVRSCTTNESPVNAGLLRGIHEALDRRGMRLTMATVREADLSDTSSLPRVLSEHCCDGLLFHSDNAIPPEVMSFLDEQQIPTVWINTDLPCDSVRLDDFRAGQDAAERLLQLGHRRIAYVRSGQTNHVSDSERFGGCAHAMGRIGLQPERIIGGPVDRGGILNWLIDLMRSEDRPTAIIAYEQHEAIAAYVAAVTVGLSVPRDLSIVTFHDSPCLDMGRLIDTYKFSTGEMGRHAVDILMQRIEAPEAHVAVRKVAFQLVSDPDQSTCGPVPQ